MRAMAMPYSASSTLAASVTAFSISGVKAARPRMGQPLRTIWRVTSVRITLRSWFDIQYVTSSLFSTLTVPTRLRMSFDGVDDLHRVVAEHPQRDDHAGLGVLDVVDAAAEGLARVLAGADEEHLRPVGVAVGGPVDDDAEEHDLVGVELVLARAERADDLTLVDEDGDLVGLDDRSGALADVDVGPLEDDLLFLVIRYRDELAADLVLQDSHGLASLITPGNAAAGPANIPGAPSAEPPVITVVGLL